MVIVIIIEESLLVITMLVVDRLSFWLDHPLRLWLLFS